MASRRTTSSQALSLKARAIALLAQREHSVSELRRKLLRLAQLRDLQAWVQAHAPAADGWPPGDGASTGTDAGAGTGTGAERSGVRPLREAEPSSVLPRQGRLSGKPAPSLASGQARRGIGSFDLDDDWDDGELEAFMKDWAQDQETAPTALSQASAELAAAGRHAPAAPPVSPVQGRARPADHEAAQQAAQGAGAEGGLEGGQAGGQAEDPEARSSSRRRAARGGLRAAAPAAEALNAVMEDERQQAREDEVEQLLQWLQQRGYLNESRLVESRINARAARYGNLRIRQELKQLGVAPDEEQQARLNDSELARAREVWRRKFGGEAPVDAVGRARQMRFLAARGFSSEVVRQVLRGDDD